MFVDRDELQRLADPGEDGSRTLPAAVAELVARVGQWLGERAGEFGRSTIREDAELTRIGYPQSQTLVRRSDRAALTRLFARLDMDIRGVPKPETLLGHLRTWTRQRP